MKRATKLGRPPKVVEVSVSASTVPEAETGHNLYVALRELTTLVGVINERTKRLEAAVVPPRSLSDRAKSFVGM